MILKLAPDFHKDYRETEPNKIFKEKRTTFYKADWRYVLFSKCAKIVII